VSLTGHRRELAGRVMVAGNTGRSGNAMLQREGCASFSL
jgi:hypothetical protein